MSHRFCAAIFHADQYKMLVRDSRSRRAPSTWTWWSVLAALVLLAGCAASESQQSTSSNAQSIAQAALAGESTAAQHSNLTGLWEGTSTASCVPFQLDVGRCDAVMKITLEMLQQGSKLTGHYTCATGNMVCRDSNTTGTIADGKIRDGAAALRVMLPDGSSCLFNGRPSRNTIAGSYFCLQGGGFIEQGRFQVQHSS